MLTEASETRIVADDMVSAIDQGDAIPPADWGAKSLYLREYGARHWLDIASTVSNSICGTWAELQRQRIAALRDVAAATYVSLGPGDGLHDVDIVATLRARSNDFVYLPVDISRHLLGVAIKNVGPYVGIPIAIQCDFETGHRFLADAITRYRGRPLLFTLLGGTIGNVDCGEQHFLSGMLELLGKADRFLVEIPLSAPDWSPARESRLDPASYGETFRRFLAGPDCDDVNCKVCEFAEQFELSWQTDESSCSKTILVRQRSSGRTIRNRRYQWDAILARLRGLGFEIHYAEHSFSSTQLNLGMAWVVLSA